MRHFIKYLVLTLSLLFVTERAFAQGTNVFISPDKSYSLVIPPSWKRIPQERIDKIHDQAGESGISMSILAGFGDVNGKGFNPYLQIFNSKSLGVTVNEKTLNAKADEVQNTIQEFMDKNTLLQNRMGTANSKVEAAKTDAKNGVVSIYMVSNTSNGSVIEGKLYMFFGKQEYVLLGFYNVASSMNTRKLNGNNDLTKLVEKTVDSFQFAEAYKYNPKAVNTDIFGGVLEKGVTGLIAGGLFALFAGIIAIGKKKKEKNEPKGITTSIATQDAGVDVSKKKRYLNRFLIGALILLIVISIFVVLKPTTSVPKEEINQTSDASQSEAEEADTFEKKVACEKVITPIENELNQKEMERLDLPSIPSLSVHERFGFGFYSPVTNSCLYVTFVVTNIGEREDTIRIHDALTKMELYRFPNDGVGSSSFSEYSDKVSELSNGEIQIN